MDSSLNAKPIGNFILLFSLSASHLYIFFIINPSDSIRIPQGKVVTYGQIGTYLGNRNLARAIGNILHANPDADRYPCYKVVSAAGKLSKSYAFGGLDAQKRRLEADGISVQIGTVDLAQYQWGEGA